MQNYVNREIEDRIEPLMEQLNQLIHILKIEVFKKEGEFTTPLLWVERER